MTLSDFLDYIVSESWIFITVFIFLISVPTLMILWRPFKKLVPARITQITVSVLSFVLLMYLLLSHHGYAVQFTGGLTNGKEVCLVELHYEGDGDGGSYETNRIYVLDLKTGERILRMNLNSSEILCVKENSFVAMNSGEVTEYDLKTGDVLHIWSEEKGFEKFEALKSGIQYMTTSSGFHQGKNEAWLQLTANDGHYFCYNLIEDKLTASQYPPEEEGEKYTYSEDEFRIKHPTDYYQDCYFTFEKVTGEIEQLMFKNYKDSVKVFDGEFLHPSVVGYSENDKLFIVRHFETLEDKHSILTAVSFQLEPVWRVEQKQIAKQDNFGENPLPGIIIPYEDKLIATFGGTVVLMNIQNGDVIWKVSL